MKADLERKLKNLENITIPRIKKEMEQTKQWWSSEKDREERDAILGGLEEELKEVNRDIAEIKSQLGV